MATFKAANIESDDESDVEIDNTKEIQIEDALKVYQNALKLHSQENTLLEAGQAYRELFDSDIFKLPEAQSEYNRVALLENQQEEDGILLAQLEEDTTTVQAGDNAPSTLPQLLHLSYKNRGEYHLDLLQFELEDKTVSTTDRNGETQVTRADARKRASDAMIDFAEALDKDEDDLDLWRRTGRVTQALGSERTSRFSVEAAVEASQEGQDDVLNLPHYELRFDRSELRRILDRIQDQLSLSQEDSNDADEDALPSVLRNQLTLYPFLSTRLARTKSSIVERDRIHSEESQITMELPDRSLDSVGNAILLRLKAERDGSVFSQPGAVVRLVPPAEETESTEIQKIVSPEMAPRELSQKPGSVADNEGTSVDGLSSRRSSPAARRKSSVVGDRAAQTVDLPTRKRSTDSANLPETADGERSRSKRIRARKSTMDRATAEAVGLEVSAGYDPKNDTIVQADRWLFGLMQDVFRKMDVKMLCTSDELRRIVYPSSPAALGEDPPRIGLKQPIQDLYSAMQTWSPKKTEALTKSESTEVEAVDTSNAGLLAFLESPNNRAGRPTARQLTYPDFVAYVNESDLSSEDVGLAWLHLLLTKERPIREGDGWAIVQQATDTSTTMYLDDSLVWTPSLKETVSQLVSVLNDELYQHVLRSIASRGQDQSHWERVADMEHALSLAQTLFELHLDSLTSGDKSEAGPNIDRPDKLQARVEQWCYLTRDLLAAWVTSLKRALDNDHDQDGKFTTDSVALDLATNDLNTWRHMWASAFLLKSRDDASRDYLLQCIEDLKAHVARVEQHQDFDNTHRRPTTLTDLKQRVLLPNNSTIPELSIEAANNEISKLETMDFFLSIFHEDKQDPVDLIEKLEPILTPSLRNQDKPIRLRKLKQSSREASESIASSSTASQRSDSPGDGRSVLSEFLRKAGASLRLSLWYRLRNAYQAIEFQSKVLAINLQIIDLILREIQSTEFSEIDEKERERTLLTWLHELQQLLNNVHEMVENKTASLDCLDLQVLQDSTSAFITLFYLLHTVSLYDDYSQAAQKGPPLTNPFKTYPHESFHTASIVLHDMQLRTMMMLYRMMQEAATQLPNRFPHPAIDRYELLQYYHYALGVRRLCKASDNLYLRFMKDELDDLTLLGQPTADDIAQVLFDLYDLNCFSSAAAKQDHGCEADYLDRATALSLVDFVLDRALRANMKDLPKVDIGKAVEKLQSALGIVKSTDSTLRNKKLFQGYIKSPINPIELFESLKGIGSLSTVPISAKEAPIASKGWYFLMAQINLAKYRRSKGQPNPGTDDLQVAVNFLGHDLEYDSEKWETWFRLAYADDSLVEESVLWSAEKINSGQQELAQMQRAAIHAYTQAVANVLRSSPAGEETFAKMAELYQGFATRIYSSARPPFEMHVFELTDLSDRYCSGLSMPGVTYTRKLFNPLNGSQALKLSALLYKRAIKLNPNSWFNHFMFGKCLWKMHQANVGFGYSAIEVALEALKEFQKAIKKLVPRKDPGRQEPTLEPIYKVVFVADKMVTRNEIDRSRASHIILDALQEQNQFDMPKMPVFNSEDSWVDFILNVLRTLRGADRSKWHHRLVFKITQMLYKKNGQSPEAAGIAKDYMAEEKLYSTKTLALTVWKPDNERAGRHWIYMTRYARFLTRLLEETEDVEGMQMLARRVRKKSNEFYDHEALWEEVCNAHVRTQRRHGKIPVHNYENTIAMLNNDEFRPKADQIDAWCSNPSTSHVLLDVMREAVEFRKINANLAKSGPIDELVMDTYAAIYTTIGPTLGPPPPRSSEPALTTNVTANATPEPQSRPSANPTPEKPNAMALNNLMNMDGAADSAPGIRLAAGPVTAIAPPPEAVPRIRPPKLISKREVLKRATEATIAKVTALPSADAQDKPTEPGAKDGPAVKVVISARRKSTDATAMDVDANTERNAKPAERDLLGPGGATGHGTSADASSELSEMDVDALDEDDDEDAGEGEAEADLPAATRPMFPRLMAKEPDGASSDADVEGDEGDEPEDEEEEEEGDEQEEPPRPSQDQEQSEAPRPAVIADSQSQGAAETPAAAEAKGRTVNLFGRTFQVEHESSE